MGRSQSRESRSYPYGNEPTMYRNEPRATRTYYPSHSQGRYYTNTQVGAEPMRYQGEYSPYQQPTYQPQTYQHPKYQPESYYYGQEYMPQSMYSQGTGGGYVVDETAKRPSSFRGHWDSMSGSVQRGMGRMFKSEPMVERGTTKKAAGKAQVYASKHPGVAAVVEHPSYMVAPDSTPVLERDVYYETPLTTRGERHVGIVEQQPTMLGQQQQPVSTMESGPEYLESEQYERGGASQVQQRTVTEDYSRGQPVQYRVVKFEEPASAQSTATSSSAMPRTISTASQQPTSAIRTAGEDSGWTSTGNQPNESFSRTVVTEISAVTVAEEPLEQ